MPTSFIGTGLITIKVLGFQKQLWDFLLGEVDGELMPHGKQRLGKVEGWAWPDSFTLVCLGRNRFLFSTSLGLRTLASREEIVYGIWGFVPEQQSSF